jgi:NAD(P)-dependent dehydrogenase (short-subunit alcohol dehydrogenase family)
MPVIYNEQGRVITVTGAGSGMGRAIAAAYAASGASVAAADISESGLNELQSALKEQDLAVEPIVADVSTEEGANTIIDQSLERFGRLDVLVNCAGILDRLLLAADTPPDLWDRVLAVNLRGPFLTCRRAIPAMIAQGGGVIINIGSSAASRGGRAGAAYTASKHGLVGLGRNIGLSYREQGIRCVTVSPSAMSNRFGGDADVDARRDPAGLALGKKVAAILPDRFGTPDDIANIVMFLASDQARHITASEVRADAGVTNH